MHIIIRNIHLLFLILYLPLCLLSSLLKHLLGVKLLLLFTWKSSKTLNLSDKQIVSRELSKVYVCALSPLTFIKSETLNSKEDITPKGTNPSANCEHLPPATEAKFKLDIFPDRIRSQNTIQIQYIIGIFRSSFRQFVFLLESTMQLLYSFYFRRYS